jgi:hypothetical protein
MCMKTQGEFQKSAARRSFFNVAAVRKAPSSQNGPWLLAREGMSAGSTKRKGLETLKCKNEAIMFLKTKDPAWVRLPKRTHLGTRTKPISGDRGQGEMPIPDRRLLNTDRNLALRIWLFEFRISMIHFPVSPAAAFGKSPQDRIDSLRQIRLTRLQPVN